MILFKIKSIKNKYTLICHDNFSRSLLFSICTLVTNLFKLCSEGHYRAEIIQNQINEIISLADVFMNDLKLHICSNVSYWMGSWDDGWVWGCLPDELSSTKNPESIFLSTPKKGEAGPSSAGTTDFLSDFVSFHFLSDYQIIFLILVWGSHFLSEFLLSSDFPILILFSCPGQLNNWHCLSLGPLVPWSEPTNNQSLGSIKEWP